MILYILRVKHIPNNLPHIPIIHLFPHSGRKKAFGSSLKGQMENSILIDE